MRWVMVRHGRTAWNAERRYQGWQGPGLDARGRRAMRALGRDLGGTLPEPIWCSDLPRARESAALLVPGASARAEPRLRELSFGAAEGKTYEDLLAADVGAYERWLADPTRVTLPGGESLDALLDRVGSWWAEASPTGGTVVAHGGSLRALLVVALGWPWARASHVPWPPAGAVLLEPADPDPLRRWDTAGRWWTPLDVHGGVRADARSDAHAPERSRFRNRLHREECV